MAQQDRNVSSFPFREVPAGQTSAETGAGEPLRVDADEFFLKQAIQENPDKGIELLYRRYYQPLCSHAIKYVGAKTIAEDLVSDVFFDFYRTQAYAAITSSYRFYLFRAVRNRAFTHLKQTLRLNEIFDDQYDPARADGQSPQAISEFEELYQDVQNAINTLPISRRRIYLMNRFEGKRYQEIADELNLSVKTVEVQLYRANKLIRTLLQHKWLPIFLLWPLGLC